MQRPSFTHISLKTASTLKRFPFSLASALIAVICGVYLADHTDAGINFLTNLMLVAFLGIPLFTVSTLIAEKQEWPFPKSLILHVAGILLLIGYYFTLPPDLNGTPFEHVYRYMIYVLAVHLLVAIGPFLKRNDVNNFWQYNKHFFLRFLTAVFFTGVLFVGLAVALGSIQVLLEVDIKGTRYLQLFIILTGIFNTWFFLAGIPSSLEIFSQKSLYPKGLKIFTQNILIPLVMIYLIILYVYMGKIIVQWNWPEGWVANLVLSFSIVGILALLLLYPIRDAAENKWIRQFSSSFFVALIPLVMLLLLAILRRIWEYHFTVERYFVLILGLWLAGIVLYFLLSKKINIKVIPASLCLIAFLISFGPWGAFSVSERSQVNRLSQYLQKANLLQNNTIQEAGASVSFEDRKEISNILRYLNETHGLDRIQPWFDQDFSQLTTSVPGTNSTRPVGFYDRPQQVVELMGIEYVQPGVDQPTVENQFFKMQGDVIDVQEINTVARNLHWLPAANPQERLISANRTLIIESDSTGLTIYKIDQKEKSIRINLESIIQQLTDKFPRSQPDLPAESMTFDFASDSLEIRLYINHISWKAQNDQINLENVQFDIGLK